MAAKNSQHGYFCPPNEHSVSATGAGDDVCELAEDRLEQELAWCIDQLQIGLESRNATSRQEQEALKVLKILRSTKFPVVKKRQAMRNTFGDYRKKMREQEKQSAAAAKRVKLSSVAKMDSVKAQFFKKSSSHTCPVQSQEAQASLVSAEGVPFNRTCEDVRNSFRFNFNITEDGDHSNTTDNENGLKCDRSMCDTSDGSGSEVKRESENDKFNFEKSDNTFRFNFSTSDDTSCRSAQINTHRAEIFFLSNSRDSQ